MKLLTAEWKLWLLQLPHFHSYQTSCQTMRFKFLLFAMRSGEESWVCKVNTISLNFSVHLKGSWLAVAGEGWGGGLNHGVDDVILRKLLWVSPPAAEQRAGSCWGRLGFPLIHSFLKMTPQLRTGLTRVPGERHKMASERLVGAELDASLTCK